MSQTTRRIALFFCFTFSLAVLSTMVQAQTLTVLHNFTGGGDGSYPEAGLTMDRQGNLYGTTAEGGAHGYGVVFRLSHAGSGWVLTPLYSFDGSDGGYPISGVVFGPDGALYGTTPAIQGAGLGTVYRLRPSPAACHAVLCPWEKTVVFSFPGGNGGQNPGPGNLIFDGAGNIYGTTEDGGQDHLGVVYELTPSNGSWTETVLWYFSSVDMGYLPLSGVVLDSSGNLYGTTSRGGTSDNGVVYQLTPSGSGWTENVLVSLSTSRADAGLVIDGQGNLFGNTCCGRLYDHPGDAFELTPSNGGWTFNELYTFSTLGYGPEYTPTLDAAGNIHGTSSGGGLNNMGEVFKLTLSNGSWTYTSVSFDGSNGSNPEGSVILDAAGNIYGTAQVGGNGACSMYGTTGCGVVWEITP